jgi:DNA-binding beta-propeller fold protein YncE
MVKAVMRLAKFLPLVVLGALLWAPAGSATSLTPKATFYVPLPIPITLQYKPWAETAAVAVSPDGNLVYVTDEQGNEVWQFSSDGVLLSKWTSSRLRRPTGVATDPLGNVYVANNGNGTVVKFTAAGKPLKSWSVPAAKSIAIGGGRVYVLTTLFNAVGEYSYAGAQLTGFVASFPDQWWGFSGYDPPSTGIAKEIGADSSGNPIVVGESDQPLSSPEPDCSGVFSIHHQLDHHPYSDPLRSGEAVRFTPAGVVKDHGFMNHSDKDCTNGWLGDGYVPDGVAVDPNGGDVYVPDTLSERIEHLQPNLVDPDVSNGLPGSHVLSMPCYICGKQIGEAPIVAGPLGAAFDCRSNLYVAFATGFLVKYLNQQPPTSPNCHKQLPFEALGSPLHVLGGLDATGGNKGMEMKLGCALHVCTGTLHLVIPSCRLCAVAPPLHFKLRPGTQRTFTLGLKKRVRTLLGNHPGLKVQVRAVVKGLKKPLRVITPLLEHEAVSSSCGETGGSGGTASVSGALQPAVRGAKLVVEYQSPDHSTIVRHRVLASAGGRYTDRVALALAGRWIIVVRWGGGGGREPARSPECFVNVPQVKPTLTLSCPSAASYGVASSLNGNLSIAGRRLVVEYVAPSGKLTSHVVSSGGFSDRLVPVELGTWQAFAAFAGDSNDAPALSSTCSFSVGRAATALSVSCTPSADKKTIACQGQLLGNSAGLGGRSLTVTYENTGTDVSTPHTDQTAANGAYTDSLSAPPGALLLGNWQVTVQFAGETDYAPSSASQSLTVSLVLPAAAAFFAGG